MRPIQTQSEQFGFRLSAPRTEDLDDYRWERQRQLDEREKTTGGNAADEADWKLRNKPLITWKDYLKGKAGQQPVPMDPHFTYTPPDDVGYVPPW